MHLPDGRVRQYSLCNDPADSSFYRLAIKREHRGRGGSNWIHENLAAGMEVQVSAPRNHFELSPAADRHLLLAGGIGITPILAMSLSLGAQAKPFAMHYFSRSRALTPLMSDTEQAGHDRCSFHFDDEPDTRTDLDTLLAVQAPGLHLYCCGPSGFMAAVRQEAGHWPQEALHFEAFQAAPGADFVAEPFAIELRSGLTVEVPADRSALEALRLAGLDLVSSCETGVCGTCECGYLDGEPIHRDAVLSPEARLSRFMPCVSRATGTLKLDL
jgi:vanillate O-demethylase ferredoxin subunit